MKTNRKHGFTIVELVVVIAIIAVLAAVLIPTFTSIIKKANDSAYLQERQSQQIADLAEKVEKLNYFTWEDFEKKLAEELAKVDTSNASAIESAVNKAIAKYAENQQSGNTGLTAEQVQKIVNESMKGQLTTAQVEEIVNQAVSKIGGVNVADVQAIVKSAIAGMGQTGLNAKQVKDLITQALEGKGLANEAAVKEAIAQALAKFETLSEQEVAAIVSQAIKDTIPSEGTIYIDDSRTLEAGKTYILRTQKSIETVTLTVPNNTEIERIIIDAPNVKTVNIVYETGATQMIPVKLIEVISTASTSTHINVNATSIEVNKGRAVVGDSATVIVTTVTAAPSTNANVVIELAENATVENPVIAEYQDNGTGTNDTITIIDNTASTEGVEVKLTASNELAASGTTTTNVQIEGTNYTEDNIVSKIDNKVAETAPNVEVVEVTVNDTTYVDAGESTNGYSLFAGGSGTADDPFLIYDYATFQNVSTLYGKGYYNFKVKDGVTSIDCKNWTPVKLYGSIDGNGVVLNNLDSTLFAYAWNDRDEDGKAINVVKISNMTLNCSIFDTGSTAALIRTAADDLYVDNVDVHGQIVGYSVGGYVDYGSGNFGDADTRNWQVTFENCDNDAHLVSFGEGVGGFVQHPYCDVSQGKTLDLIVNGKSLIQIIDSAFTGKITSVSNMDYFAYQGNHIHVMTSYSEAFLSKLGYNPEGTLYKSMTKDSSGMFDAGNYSNAYKNNDPVTNHYPDYPQNGNDAGKYRPNDSTNSTYKLKITSTGSNPANYGDAYTFTKVNGATTAKIAFMISPNSQATESGSYTGTYVDETIDISALSNGNTFTTDVIKYWTIAINPDGVSETGLTGTQYNVVNSFYGKTHNGSNIYAVQYASNGEVVGITTVNVCPSNAVVVRYNGSTIKSAGAGNSYVYDCGEDLTGKTVTIKIYDRKTSTWTYTYEETELVKTLVQGTDFTVSGSTITINNVEGIKLRNSSLYNYFKEYCRYVITID